MTECENPFGPDPVVHVDSKSRPVRWSLLKHMARSPAHYRHALDHGVPETGPKRLGAAVHHYVLGGDDPPVVFTGSSRRTKEWQTFSREHAGKTILLESEARLAEKLANAVFDCQHAMERIALGGMVEHTLGWTIGGRECRGRIDSIGVDLTELKTGYDVDPKRFYWEAQKLGYIGQLGWYWDGVLAAGLPPPRVPCIIAVESKAPHPVVVYDLPEEVLVDGRRQWRALFDRLLECERTGIWPGYADGPIPLARPDRFGDVGLDFTGMTEDGDVAAT